MENIKINDNHLARLTLSELRQKWAEKWGLAKNPEIGRVMLEKSLMYKIRQARGEGLTVEQQKRLDNLVAAYKRNPKFFEEGGASLKPGLRLVKLYHSEHHSVLVQVDGFEYRSKVYSSLSEVAFAITGTKWNGWVFFGLKKRGKREA